MLVICVAGVPVVVLGLVRWLYGVPVYEFRPFLNDEVTYWHQILTFSAAGFRGGYYTLGELTNASGVTPFGPHGPGFVVAYGLFGAVFGWHRHSSVVMNLAAIASAAWLFVTLPRLNTARTLLGGLVLITFGPMIFWAPTAMQESLHHAGAIAMAACFAHALGTDCRRSVKIAGWIALVILSYIRPSWLVLLPLWAVATTRESSPRFIGAAIAASGVLAAAVLMAYGRTTAPYATGFLFLRGLDPAVGVRSLWENLRTNVGMVVAFANFEPQEILFRAQYWSWLAATAVWAGIQLRRRRDWPPSAAASHAIVAVSSTAAALALILLLYAVTNEAEHRVLSAFLLFSALLCVAAPGKTGPLLAAVLVASNLATTRMSLAAFEENRHDNFIWDRRGVYELLDGIDGRVAYHPNASRWCNTLLTSQYPPHLIAVPAGIGISVVREPNVISLPLKSRYVLLDPPALADFSAPLRLTPIATLPYGTLFENLDSGCVQ